MKASGFTERTFLICFLTALLVSCSTLPVIQHTDSRAAVTEKCRLPFLDMPYRYVHAIEVTVSGVTGGTVMGVTVVNPQAKAVRSAIITLEGFLLFDAEYEKEITIHHALPPFDGKDFSEHMMEDIRLVFLPPEGRLEDAGVIEDGSSLCRYEVGEGGILDVIVHRDDAWEIGTYSSPYERVRKIRAFDLKKGIPGILELTTFKGRTYALKMTLLDAEPVTPETTNAAPVGTPSDSESEDNLGSQE
jgi:hypothetical protein